MIYIQVFYQSNPRVRNPTSKGHFRVPLIKSIVFQNDFFKDHYHSFKLINIYSSSLLLIHQAFFDLSH